MNCDNCGACCLSQTSPPGYTGEELVLFATPEDEELFYAAPQEARDAIWTWQDRIDAIPNGEPLPADEPCCWLDLETMRCRWYEWRPSVCREFDVGGKSCLAWRDRYSIDVESPK